MRFWTRYRFPTWPGAILAYPQDMVRRTNWYSPTEHRATRCWRGLPHGFQTLFVGLTTDVPYLWAVRFVPGHLFVADGPTPLPLPGRDTVDVQLQTTLPPHQQLNLIRLVVG